MTTTALDLCDTAKNVCIQHIMKTGLFKYTENFTTKNWKFSDKNSDIFFIFLFKT